MSLVLTKDSARTATDTLARIGEEVVSGMRVAEYTTLGLAGYTLATAKTVKLGAKVPKDKVLGVVHLMTTLDFPLANGADGRARSVKINVHGFKPCDATTEECAVAYKNLYDVFGSTEMDDLWKWNKSAI